MCAMSTISVPSVKLPTASLALAPPMARAQLRLQQRLPGRPTASSIAGSPNLSSRITLRDCSQSGAAAAPASGGVRLQGDGTPLISRFTFFSSVKGRRGNSLVPTQAVSGVAAAEGGAPGATTATVTTTGISLEDLRRKSDSYFVTDSRPVVLFDGICNFCNSGVNFLLDNDPEGKFRFASLQSEAGRALLVRSGRSPDDLSSIVLVHKDREMLGTKPQVIGKHLGIPNCNYNSKIGELIKWLVLNRPMSYNLNKIGVKQNLLKRSDPSLLVRDAAYDQVANNRYNIFGTANACRLSDPRFPERFVE